MSWLLVDDFPAEAKAFADKLATGADKLKVDVAPPDQARQLLLTKAITPAGILMDVDLSNLPGERGSGPGLAQDVRVKQRAREIDEYPIVRFSGRVPIERNLKGDPGSD